MQTLGRFPMSQQFHTAIFVHHGFHNHSTQGGWWSEQG